MSSFVTRHNCLMDMLALTVGITLFYCLFIGSYPLFTPDEGRYSEVAKEMVVSGDYITPRVNGVAFLDKPILYYWLQALAIHLFGLKEWALRFFPMLFGMGGCLVTYANGRLLFDRRTGLLSAAILATTPLYFGNAHYADLNLEVAVLISTTLLFFISAIQTHGQMRTYLLIVAYISTALAFLTKGLIGLALPGLIGLIWLLLVKRINLLRKIHLFPGILLFLLIALPWYLLVEKINPGFLHYFFILQQATRFLSAATFNNPTPFWFYVPIVIIGFFPWIIFLPKALFQFSYRQLAHSAKQQNILFLLLWALLIFTFFSIPHSKTVGYILPIFPALALLVGHYLSSLWEQQHNNSFTYSAILFIIIGTALAGALWYLPNLNWLDMSAHFAVYRVLMIIILLLSITSALITLSRKKKLLPLFFICLLSNISFLLTLTHGALYLNQNSTKDLVTALKPLLKPQDEVITYLKYYQDLPLYLGRRVIITADWQAKNIGERDNWLREFWFGLPFQNTKHWLINETEFWQHYESRRRVFVFLNDNYFMHFKQRAKYVRILGKCNNVILLTNQPIP